MGCREVFATQSIQYQHNQTWVEIPFMAGWIPFGPLLVETLAIKIHRMQRTGNPMLRSEVVCSELCQGVFG